MVARVKVLPETLLQDSLYECRSHSLDKHRLMAPAALGKGATDHFQSQKRLYDRQYKVPYSIWPSWVHRSYDLQLVTQRVGQELRQSIFLNVGSSPKTIRIPSDPVELSYWVIQNLPLDEEQRLELLSINNPNQRLRAELSFLQRVLSNFLIIYFPIVKYIFTTTMISVSTCVAVSATMQLPVNQTFSRCRKRVPRALTSTRSAMYMKP